MAKRTKIALYVLSGMVAAYLLLAFTPLRHTIPGYPTEESRRMAMETLVKMDSLERVIGMWEFRMQNVCRIADGKEPLPLDSTLTGLRSKTDSE